MGQPNFAHIPMSVAVIAPAEELAAGGELSKDVAFINDNQSYYKLVPISENDALWPIWRARLQYEAVLVFDSEMMLNGCSYTRKGVLLVAFVEVRKDGSNPFFYNHVIHKCSSVKTHNVWRFIPKAWR